MIPFLLKIQMTGKECWMIYFKRSFLMFRYLLSFILLLFIVTGCATTDPKSAGPAEGVKSFAFVDGQVVDVAGDMFTIRANLNLDKSGMDFNQRVAATIVEKAFLLENMVTRINGKKATVIEGRGYIYIFAGQGHKFTTGQQVKIFVPKKTLAVTNFKALKNNEEIGDLWLEDLTTAMVNTGQFNVVERSRLGTILTELKLEMSGLTDSSQASKVGKLLNADIILTGSVADMGGYWNANLRLVNTATSVILTAINDKITYGELKPDSLRDSSPLNASFEDGKTYGFNVGYKERKGSERNTIVDSIGANGTKKCLRTDFSVNKKKGRINLANTKDRDLSMYKGAEFYAKGDKPFNIKFRLVDENRDNPHAIDIFQYNIRLTKEWKKYRVDFSELRYKKPRDGEGSKEMRMGDTVLNLDLIRDVIFFYSPSQSPLVNGQPTKSGTYWVDEVKFY
ncbi:MAG: hypothetical protein C0603_05195 [Denitrovibrio sp.]|nr:MAG: hypothetical protein C0603_05195 [Denitrovibrio sp.]